MHAVFKLTHHSFLQPFIVLQLDVVHKPTYMCLYMQDRWRERSVYIYIYIFLFINTYSYHIHVYTIYSYIYIYTHMERDADHFPPLNTP